MTRFAYVNGRYVRHAAARVHVEDRGFQFADAVYEVCAVREGILIDEAPHIDRLERSLAALRISMPVGRAALGHILGELVRRNGVRDGLVYMQVSRGQARRDHAFPVPSVRPTLVVTARSLDLSRYDVMAAKGVKVLLTPETRWARCDIKSTALLANVLAKQAAREADCFEAWFVGTDGLVTEGSSTNAWIVDSAGRLRTRALSHQILPGITRAEVLALCRTDGIVFSETAFSAAEIAAAREAFVTAATLGVMPVVQVGPHVIGEGVPGPVATKLRAMYRVTRPT